MGKGRWEQSKSTCGTRHVQDTAWVIDLHLVKHSGGIDKAAVLVGGLSKKKKCKEGSGGLHLEKGEEAYRRGVKRSLSFFFPLFECFSIFGAPSVSSLGQLGTPPFARGWWTG